MVDYGYVDCSNLRQIGKGVTALAYRLDDSRMIKSYNKGITLEQIENEKNITLKVCSYGVNTPMCYGTVKTNTWYGNIYQYLSGGTFTDQLLSADEEGLSKWIIEYAKLARSLNVKYAGDDLNDYISMFEHHLDISRDILSEEVIEMIEDILKKVPRTNNFLHGDMSTGNIMLENEKLYFVDLATVGKGHPIIDLTVPYMVTIMWPEFARMVNDMTDEEKIKQKDWFLYLNRYTEKCLSYENGIIAWKLFLKNYFDLSSLEDEFIDEITGLIQYFSMAKYCMCGSFKSIYSSELLEEMVNFYSNKLMGCKKPDMELLRDDRWCIQKA